MPAAAATIALIGSACETATIVSPGCSADQAEHGVHGAHRHLGEGLAAGEAEPAGPALDRRPLLVAEQPGQRLLGPVADVDLDAGPGRCAPAGRGRGRWAPPSPGCARAATRRRRSGALARAAMRSATASAWARPFSERCRPGGPAREHLAGGGRRAVPHQEHDGRRGAPCGRGAVGGRAEVDRADGGTNAHRRLCAVASNRAHEGLVGRGATGRGGLPALPAPGRLARGGGRGRAGRPTPARCTGAAASRASATRARALVIVGLAPAAHGANRTGPHVHRRPLRRLALRAPSTGPGSRRSRRARRADDGLDARATRTSRRPSTARRRPTSPTPTSAPTARRTSPASSRC